MPVSALYRGLSGRCRTKMKEYELKYGCNPNQKPAKIYMENGEDLPIEILNGRPGYINLLDAMNSWQLVKEIQDALLLVKRSLTLL